MTKSHRTEGKDCEIILSWVAGHEESRRSVWGKKLKHSSCGNWNPLFFLLQDMLTFMFLYVSFKMYILSCHLLVSVMYSFFGNIRLIPGKTTEQATKSHGTAPMLTCVRWRTSSKSTSLFFPTWLAGCLLCPSHLCCINVLMRISLS